MRIKTHVFPLKAIAIFTLLLLISFNFVAETYTQEVNKKQAYLLINVEPRTIALPGNPGIVRVPISAARIRSTELRQLNEKYNAVEIERLFEVKQEEKTGAGKITGAEDALMTKETQKKKKSDLTNILTAETVKKLKKEKTGESKNLETIEKADTYLIVFEFTPGNELDMNAVAGEYKALPVVKEVEYVVKKAAE